MPQKQPYVVLENVQQFSGNTSALNPVSLIVYRLSDYTHTHKILNEVGPFFPFTPGAASLDTYGRTYLQENQS